MAKGADSSMCGTIPENGCRPWSASSASGRAAWFWLGWLLAAASAWGCRVKRVEPGTDQQHTGAALASASSSARSVEPRALASAGNAAPGPVASERRKDADAAIDPEGAPVPPQSALGPATAGAPELLVPVPADLPRGVAAVAFSGPGTDPAQTGGLTNAVRHALRALTNQSSPLEAAVAGATMVEDDPLLNAGTGAVLRLDGSAELEVLLMDSSGRMGGVAAVQNVQHPVRLALAATSTPHHLLVGDGAQRFASWLGLPSYDPRTPRQLSTYRALTARFLPGQAPQSDVTVWPPALSGPGAEAWKAYLDPAAHPPATGTATANPPPDVVGKISSDEATPAASTTAVAVLVRGGPGRFAGAIETGGAWLALPGSVGAIATPGAALYVASRGAVALAGPNQRLLTDLLARRTYDKLLAFQNTRAAAEWALGQAKAQPISIVVMDDRNIVTLSNATMAWAKADPREKNSAAPAPLTTAAPQPMPNPTPTPELPTSPARPAPEVPTR